MIEFLESMKAPSGREQYININPKYFFNKQTWETILKLKQIFLNLMMMAEMQEIFESNKISASINDLVDLFFQGKKFKENEIMKLNKEKEKIKIVNKVKILEENNKKKMMKKKENTFR